MGRKKVVKALEQDILETKARMKEITDRSSKEYADLYQHLKESTELYAKLCPDHSNNGWEIAFGVGSLALGAAGLWLRAKLAEESHKADEEMLISNGRLFSLAEKPIENFKGLVDTKIGSKK